MQIYSNFRLGVFLAMVFGFIGAHSHAKDINAYVFGNSLIHHKSESTETSAPHWVHHIANAAGDGFAIDGQWGFLRNFSVDLPPTANWSFDPANGVWNPDQTSFGAAGFDTILINPANFIQGTAPNEMTEWENPTGRTPVDDSLMVFDWITAQTINPKFYLYEGWPEMDGLVEGNAPPDNFRRYYDAIDGAYHDWYADWATALGTKRPQYDITLIPVASILADILRSSPFSDIPTRGLYLDDAPHGTASLYFLAGAITYSALYQTDLPAGLSLPETIDARIRDNLAVLNDIIQSGLQNDHAALENMRHVQASITTGQSAGQGVPNPPLAMGLNGIADWSTQHPFIDVMKTARPWVGHLPGQWGGWDTQDIDNAGLLDSDGWPMFVPKTLTAIETFILTDQPKEAKSLSGWYRLTYEGKGEIKINGRAKKTRYKDGEIRFYYTPGDGPVGIAILETDPDDMADYIRNIQVIREEHQDLHDVGALFNPDWIAHIADLRALRFMDWMFTNGSLVAFWKDRPTASDYTYVRRGVPLETMIVLANQIGADAWFNMPHMADDTYARNFAQMVHDTLDPSLTAYVEYSNELWNFTFPQAHWVAEQATLRWGENAADDAWLQFAGMRAAEITTLWSDVFADAPARISRVIATHTGWPGLEEGLLKAPLYLAENPDNQPPIVAFDAYAVTGYFGLELGTDDGVPEVLQWISDSRTSAENAGKALGYKRVKLRVYVEEHQFDGAIKPAIARVKDGSLNDYLTNDLPYQAAVARVNDLDLIMYEGGTHIAGLGAQSNNDDLTAFFNFLNYTPEMAGLYNDLLVGWRAAGGALFNAFVDVSKPSQYGSWGSLRHLDDHNPRHDALVSYNTNIPAWWEGRPSATFLQGGIFVGTQEQDTMAGTVKSDIFLAGDGDDRIVATGRGDLIHGGQGRDTVVFTQNREAYHITRTDDGHLIAQSDHMTVQMTAVEVLVFNDGPVETAQIP